MLKDPIAEFNAWNISSGARSRLLPSIFPFRHALDIPSPRQEAQSYYYSNRSLMHYSVNADDLARRAAGYVDKILRGARPAELPVEQPSTFDFVLNLETARQIGFTFPPSILAQATEVIR